jgi:hypothetical protein
MGLRVKLLAVAMFGVVVLCAPPTFAGVVVTEITTRGPAQAPQAEQFSLMVEGKKEKIVGDHQVILTDLEAKRFSLIYPTPKTLKQLPFPGDPPTLALVAGAALDADYTKTGNIRTIAGYSCNEYVATVNSRYTVTTVLSCFATSYPGAAEFNAFRQGLLNQLGESGVKISASLPDGILMAQESSTRLEEEKLTDLSPAIVKRLHRQAMRAASKVNKIEVKKIEVKDLPGDAFQLPSGYSDSAQLEGELSMLIRQP